MNKPNKILNYRVLTNNSKLLVFSLVIILLILSIFTRNSVQTNYFISSECTLSGISSGSDTINEDINQSGNYRLWFHIETPVQISYNLLPGFYNPFFVSIDNKSCYKVGGSYITPNTWKWISYLNSNSNLAFTTYLVRGSHTITIVGSYLSIDKVEVISPSCNPASPNNC